MKLPIYEQNCQPVGNKKIIRSYVGTAGHLYWLLTKKKHPRINEDVPTRELLIREQKPFGYFNFIFGLTPCQELSLETMNENG